MGETEQEQAAPEEETTPTDAGEQEQAAPEEEQESAPTDRMNAPTE